MRSALPRPGAPVSRPGPTIAAVPRPLEIGEGLAPPFDDAAELAVLYGLASAPEDAPRVNLRAADFYSHAHRVVYGAIRALAAEGAPINAATVRAHLGNRAKEIPSEVLAALEYLHGAGVDAPRYATIVRGLADRRQLIEAARRAAAQAYAGVVDAAEAIAELTAATAKIGAPQVVAPPPCWAARVAAVDPAWFTTAPPRRKWLLCDTRAGGRGVLPAGKVGLLISEGGAGKTMVLVLLALAHATGGEWLGTYSLPTTGRTLLVLGEEDAEEVHRRVYNSAQATRSRAPDPGAIVAVPLSGLPAPMVEIDPQGNASDGAFLVWLRAYIASSGPFELVLVDPLSRFAGADAEIDNAAATRFVQALESIATDTGATVLVAHHTNKSARGAGASVSGASARGSSAFVDGVRWAASLSVERVPCEDPEVAARLGELVTFAVHKSNYSAKGDPVLLRRDHEHGGTLLALDAPDLAMVGEARTSSNPALQRQAEREEQGRARNGTIAALVCDILRASPGMSGRALHAAVVAARGSCSRPAFEAALASLGDAVRTGPGPDRSTLHYLVSEEGQS